MSGDKALKKEINREAVGFKTMTSSIGKADYYTRWALGVFRRHLGGSLLEVGAGFANYRKFLTEIDRIVSIDIDEEVIEKARAGDPDGNYVVADIAAPDFCERIGGELFDAVLCCNVLEHIEHEEAAVRNIERSLRSGGKALLFLPAFGALYNDLDRLAGHYRRYTLKSALALFDGGAMEAIGAEYFNPIGGLGWWANKFRRHDDIDSRNVNMQVMFFDRYVAPVSRALNPVTRGFFGQSVIIVGRKT
ncbi:MAG: class I SAM-dependent methyltransferase [bacterium]